MLELELKSYRWILIKESEGKNTKKITVYLLDMDIITLVCSQVNSCLITISTCANSSKNDTQVRTWWKFKCENACGDQAYCDTWS